MENVRLYNKFKDLLLTFVGTVFKNVDDIACFIRDLKDLEEDLKNEYVAVKPTKNKDGNYDKLLIE